MGPIPWLGSVTSDQLAAVGRAGFVFDVVSDAALVGDVLSEGIPTFGFPTVCAAVLGCVAAGLPWPAAIGPLEEQAERSTAATPPTIQTRRLRRRGGHDLLAPDPLNESTDALGRSESHVASLSCSHPRPP